MALRGHSLNAWPLNLCREEASAGGPPEAQAPQPKAAAQVFCMEFLGERCPGAALPHAANSGPQTVEIEARAPFCMENAMKMVNRAVQRWEGGKPRIYGGGPTEWKMVNRAVQRWKGGRRKPVEAIHWIYAILLRKCTKKNKGITKKYNFSALRGKNCRLCYQNASREEASARRPAEGPSAAAEGCGASVLYGISW